jgi:hypothetical protein
MRDTIREPAVAGTFYPADAVELRRQVEACLGDDSPSPSSARLLLVPHAGYVYSGRIAGAAYREARVPPTCVVLAPNHHGIGAALALPRRGSWRTPLGDLAIDEAVSTAIAAREPRLRDDWRAHARDHALEVQLPFLLVRARQGSAQAPRLVTLSVGTHDLDALRAAGEAVAAGLIDAGCADPEQVLLVVSSDMSHYIPAAEARALDLPALEHVAAVEPEALHAEVLGKGISMCGIAPAVAGLFAARALGASPGRLLRYGHSGEVTGDDREVVAYAAVLVPPSRSS